MVLSTSKPDHLERVISMAEGSGSWGLSPHDEKAIQSVLSERDALRKALIATGRSIGCLLADTVSSDFLLGVPDEARLVWDRKARELAEAHTKAYDLGRETGLLIAAQYMEHIASLALSVTETDCSAEAQLFNLRAQEIRAMIPPKS